MQPRNLLFHFTPSDVHKGPSLYLRPGTGFLGRTHSAFSKACKWMTAAHNAGIQIHFMMTGSLGPLFLHSFVCQRDYCNISGLQYPHLSLWAVSQPKFDRWVSSSLSHDMHTLAGITSAGQIGKRWVRACTQNSSLCSTDTYDFWCMFSDVDTHTGHSHAAQRY